MFLSLAPSPVSVQLARQATTTALADLGREDLIDDATVIVTELVANAVMHARTDVTLSVDASGDGIRLRVADHSDILPRWTPASPTATSGRGLLLVQRLAGSWGVEPLGDNGKIVWAQIDRAAVVTPEDIEGDLLELWDAEPWPSQHPPDSGIEVAIEIGVQPMLESRAHTDDLVRDLQLVLINDTGDYPAAVVALAHRLELANEEFHEPRRQMYNQTISAARHGQAETTLRLVLKSTDADAAKRWLGALDEADALTGSGALLLPPFPPQMTAFRREYIGAIVQQLRAGGTGDAIADS